LFKGEKNIGPYAGLNFLLDKADGEYIAIQDHDDVWFLDKLDKQVQFLDKNQDYIACGTNTYYFYEKEMKFVLDKKPLQVNFVDHTSLMFRNKNFSYNVDYIFADEYFEKKILIKKGKIACIQEALTIHRIRNDGKNLSASRFNFSWKSIRQFFEINGFGLKSIMSLIIFILNLWLPRKMIWSIHHFFSKRDVVFLDYDDFIKLYRDINV
jgi:hypothetical protein